MFNTRFILFLSALAFFAACDNKGFETNENGLQYKIHSSNEGEKIKAGDVITVHYTMRNAKDSIIGNTYTQGKGEPRPMPVSAPQYKGGIEEGLVMLAKGDSATFLISADSMFKNFPRPKYIDAGSYLRLDMKVIDIQSEEQFRQQQEEKGRLQEIEVQEQMKKQKPLDDSLIKKYVEDKKLNAKSSESGLYYVVQKPGSSQKPKMGETVSVNYTGSLLNGKVFEKSEQPIEFRLGSVIQGWNEGLQLIGKGGKVKLIIPSRLAYGNMKMSEDIQPWSCLVFDVELLDIKK